MWFVSLALFALLLGVVLLAAADYGGSRHRRVGPVGYLGLALTVASLLVLWIWG